MKKLTAILICAALTVGSVVPAFAAISDAEIKAVKAAQEQKLAEYQAYQANLQALAAQAVAQGQADQANGQATVAASQAVLAANAAQALAQGQMNSANGQAVAAAGQAALAAGKAAEPRSVHNHPRAVS